VLAESTNLSKEKKMSKQTTAIVVLFFLIAGCAGMARMHIRSIQDHPEEYNNKQVVVSGKVVQVFAVPFLEQGICKIDDGTGQIWVKPLNRVPAKGEALQIRGTVKVGITLANKSFGVVVIEDREETGR
jgi:hypothetical protein